MIQVELHVTQLENLVIQLQFPVIQFHPDLFWLRHLKLKPEHVGFELQIVISESATGTLQ
jgi:hypothetical protein